MKEHTVAKLYLLELEASKSTLIGILRDTGSFVLGTEIKGQTVSSDHISQTTSMNIDRTTVLEQKTKSKYQIRKILT